MKNNNHTIREQAFSSSQILNINDLRKIKGGTDGEELTDEKALKIAEKDAIKCEKAFDKSNNGDGLW